MRAAIIPSFTTDCSQRIFYSYLRLFFFWGDREDGEIRGRCFLYSKPQSCKVAEAGPKQLAAPPPPPPPPVCMCGYVWVPVEVRDLWLGAHRFCFAGIPTLPWCWVTGIRCHAQLLHRFWGLHAGPYVPTPSALYKSSASPSLELLSDPSVSHRKSLFFKSLVTSFE